MYARKIVSQAYKSANICNGEKAWLRDFGNEKTIRDKMGHEFSETLAFRDSRHHGTIWPNSTPLSIIPAIESPLWGRQLNILFSVSTQTGGGICGHFWFPANLWGMPIQCFNAWGVSGHIPVRRFSVETLSDVGPSPVGTLPGWTLPVRKFSRWRHIPVATLPVGTFIVLGQDTFGKNVEHGTDGVEQCFSLDMLFAINFFH